MTLFSRSRIVIMTTLAVVAALALAAIITTTGQMSSAIASGVLDVDNTRFEFVPTACTATETDFVAAGSGTLDGEPFWVSATSRSVSLRVGTDSEVARPDDEQLWLTSVGEVTWQADGDGISVTAVMVDSRVEQSAKRPAVLSVPCP